MLSPLSYKQWIHLQDTAVSVIPDTGLLYGLHFFTTILVHASGQFVDEHVNRLNRSLEAYGFPIRLHADDIHRLIADRNIRNQGLRIQVSEKNVYYSTRPLPYTEDFYNKGASLTLSSLRRHSSRSLSRHKSGNYADLLLEMRRAKEEGYWDALYLNEYNDLTETSVANLFVIRNGKIYTPPISSGVLPGIIRQKILECHPVIEAPISWNDRHQWDGVFATNALLGLVHISAIDTICYPQHPVFDALAVDVYSTYYPNDYKGGVSHESVRSHH